MKPMVVGVFAALILSLLMGCSVVMATKQPGRKNLSVLKPGTERDLVVGELGAPVSTERFDGGRKDIYTFVQGYSAGAKTSRMIFHGVADIFSFGLWEAVGTPLEAVFDGKKITVRVTYDGNDKVKESLTLAVANP
jgi:outer membrane protein assembly factor BamE (lipoprotein component of BamABCDE complex)